MESINIDIVLTEINFPSELFSCTVKEFILNILVLQIVEEDKFIFIKMNDYVLTDNTTFIRFENEERCLDLYFKDLLEVYAFMQKDIYKKNYFMQDFPVLSVCCLSECLRVRDIELCKAIEEDINKLENEIQSPLFKLCLSSLVKFTGFLDFLIENNKFESLEKLGNFEIYNLWEQIVEKHKQIYKQYILKCANYLHCIKEIPNKLDNLQYEDTNENCLHHIKEIPNKLDNLQYEDTNENIPPSFYFTLSLFENEYFENILREDKNNWIIVSGGFKRLTKELQRLTVYPEDKDIVCYKDILNTNSPFYPLIFYYFCDILKYDFNFLDTKIFFEVYNKLLCQDSPELIYLTEGIIKVVSHSHKYLILSETSRFINCPSLTTFSSETDFVYSFFMQLHKFLENLPSISNRHMLNLLTGLTKEEMSFKMKELYLNSSILDKINLDPSSPREALSSIKLLISIISNIKSSKLELKCRRILDNLQKKYERSGLSSIKI